MTDILLLGLLAIPVVVGAGALAGLIADLEDHPVRDDAPHLS